MRDNIATSQCAEKRAGGVQELPQPDKRPFSHMADETRHRPRFRERSAKIATSQSRPVLEASTEHVSMRSG